MSFLEIQSAGPLHGQVKIQGSKNAVLPMMAAMILHRGITVLTNVPHILDVYWMIDILKELGCRVCLEGHVLTVDAAEIKSTALPKQLVGKMRSSIILLGALLGRCKEASTWFPGGCSIGSRPVDIHIQVLEAFGAFVIAEEEEIKASVLDGLNGICYTFPFPSVGATENAILTAVCAKGVTVLRNAAKEPEIRELCRFLNAMGAKISGIGTECLVILGVNTLHSTCFPVCGDRIAAATYLCGAAVCGGTITITGIAWSDMEAVLDVLKQCGCKFSLSKDAVSVVRNGRLKAVKYVRTEVYPGFPTDVQSPLMAVLAAAKGCSVIEETIFEGRFQTAEQLKRMGADIRIQEQRAMICGKKDLYGTDVVAMDLRGGAALVIAALAAKGTTRIGACHHIFRGYESIEEDLRQLGVKIRFIH